MLKIQRSNNKVNLDLTEIKELVEISNRLTSLVTRLAERHNLDLDELEQALDSRFKINSIGGNDKYDG